MISIRAITSRGEQWAQRVIGRLSPAATAVISNRVAMETHRMLVLATPKGYTGMTRRNWIVEQSGIVSIVSNKSKIMIFLELGTKAHGAKTKKFLFIPLNRKAALGGWNPSMKFGVDFVLAKRVKGIKAMGIVKAQRIITAKMLRASMGLYIRSILKI
jgi:hypothetical protein